MVHISEPIDLVASLVNVLETIKICLAVVLNSIVAQSINS